MYFEGPGVPQDYAEAVKWYRLAAEQGYAIAQSNLGAMYSKGQGGPHNYVAAYKWFALAKAAARPGSVAYKNASANMAALAEVMTSARIAQAQHEASAWWAAHPKGGN
jgi:TPR repeat protein